MIIDTDVLIWYMKGNDKAYDIIESQNGFFISSSRRVGGYRKY